MLKPVPWLAIAASGALLAAGARPGAVAEADAASDLAVPAAPGVEADPPPAVRLVFQRIAMRVAPLERAPSEPRPAPEDAAPAPAEPSGFRITVPMCQRAQAQNDPLAQTPECIQLLKAAKDQAEACRRAFEEGNDQHVLSPACRQAAGFR